MIGRVELRDEKSPSAALNSPLPISAGMSRNAAGRAAAAREASARRRGAGAWGVGRGHGFAKIGRRGKYARRHARAMQFALTTTPARRPALAAERVDGAARFRTQEWGNSVSSGA
jgi:hypothetical protein